MRKRICYKCGKEVYQDGLCKDCWEKENMPEDIKLSEIRMCRSCGKVFHPKMRTFVEITVIQLAEEYGGINPRIERGKVVVTLKDGEKEIPLRKIMCLVCSRRSGNYHEAKIQLRDDLDFLVDFIPEDEIVKIEELKEGVDVFILSKAGAKSFISLVKDKYLVKHSRKLVGERNGKKLYRDTYVVRKWKSK